MSIDMTTVKQIMHNNKEVAKIEDLGGNILWQKVSAKVLQSITLAGYTTAIVQAESFDGTKWTRVKTTDEIKTCKDNIAQVGLNLLEKSGYLNSNMTVDEISSYSETTGSFTHNYIIPRDGFVAITGKTLGVGYVEFSIGNIVIFELIADTNTQVAEETTIPIKGGTTISLRLNNGGFSIKLLE